MDRRLFILLIFLMGFTSLWAQSSSTDVPYQENNVAFTEIAGFSFKNAFEELRIGGYLDIDTRVFLGKNSSKSTFLIRRARIFFAGTLYKTFAFLLMPSWERNKLIDLHYAFVETLYPNWARLRIGLFKEPFSLDASKPAAYLNFVERSLIIRNYCKVIDIGLMFFGIIKELNYSISIFNGRHTRIDNNNNKELVGRLVFHPFSLKGWGRSYIGLSGATGRFDEDLCGLEFLTESDTPFWRWKRKKDRGIENHSTRYRLGGDVEWFLGSFYICAEYLYTSWGTIRQGIKSKEFRGHGGYIECSYFLTGEEKPRHAPVIPKQNFDPCRNQWGAWEIAAKYEVFYASENMIRSGFAKGANFVRSPILGINWYLNQRMLIRLDGQYLSFNRLVDLSSEKFRHEVNLILRVQAIF